MTTDFQKDSLVFAQKCFDDVRAMSLKQRFLSTSKKSA